MLLHQGGHIWFDSNGDGCDAADLAAPIRLNIQSGDLQQANYASPLTGVYAFLPGAYSIVPQVENPDYFTIAPASANVVFGANGHLVDFCIEPNGVHRDAEVTIIPDAYASPGKLASYKVVVRNKGNQPINGIVHLDYPADKTDYVWSSPTPHGRMGTTMNWQFENLLPFESRVYRLDLHVHSASATTPVNVGDELAFSAYVTMAEPDDTPADNSADIILTATAFSAPNNKIVLEGSVLPPSMIGEYLNYVINFENTGATTIQKIVVNDEIDTNQFEIASLQMVNLSHPGIPVVLGNKLEVYFQNIALPPGGHGSIAFKIKTKPTLPVNSTVSNKAKIYFDFNFPIETGAATTTFQLLNVETVTRLEATVYPNPAGGAVIIQANREMLSVVLTDAQGRKIAELPASENQFTFDVSKYTSGIYYLRIATVGGIVTRKLIVR